MSHEHEDAVEAETDPKKLSAVGGFVGTVMGSRRGPVGAIAGGIVGGTVGYLAGATLEGEDIDEMIETEPVSIDVSEPESGSDAESVESETTTDVEADDEETDTDGETGSNEETP
ncbi:MAG: hypothetical protein V5A32_05085 [Halovenus sp.]